MTIAGLGYLLEYYMLDLFVTLNLFFAFETTNQPGFELGFSQPRAAMLTIDS